MAWWHGATDDSDIENRRGHTRKGQTGWVAWLDNGHARKVQVGFGRCIVEAPTELFQGTMGMCEISLEGHDTDTLRLPDGRMDFCPAAALTNLSTDLKIAGDQEIGAAQKAMADAIARHQSEIDKISGTLLLDLVAVEQAKHAKYPEPKAKRVGQEVAKIEQTPKRIASSAENDREAMGGGYK